MMARTLFTLAPLLTLALVGGCGTPASEAPAASVEGGTPALDSGADGPATPEPEDGGVPARPRLSVVAGDPGGSGTIDGTGTGARFNFPNDAVVDSAGNVYVADSESATIRKVTSAGVVSTLAGTPGIKGSADGTGPGG